MKNRPIGVEKLYNMMMDENINILSIAGEIKAVDKNKLMINFKGLGEVLIFQRMNEAFQTLTIGSIKNFYIEVVIREDKTLRYVLNIIGENCETFKNLLSKETTIQLLKENKITLMDQEKYIMFLVVNVKNMGVQLINKNIIDEMSLNDKNSLLKVKVQPTKNTRSNLKITEKKKYLNNRAYITKLNEELYHLGFNEVKNIKVIYIDSSLYIELENNKLLRIKKSKIFSYDDIIIGKWYKAVIVQLSGRRSTRYMFKILGQEYKKRKHKSFYMNTLPGERERVNDQWCNMLATTG